MIGYLRLGMDPSSTFSFDLPHEAQKRKWSPGSVLYILVVSFHTVLGDTLTIFVDKISIGDMFESLILYVKRLDTPRTSYLIVMPQGCTISPLCVRAYRTTHLVPTTPPLCSGCGFHSFIPSISDSPYYLFH